MNNKGSLLKTEFLVVILYYIYKV